MDVIFEFATPVGMIDVDLDICKDYAEKVKLLLNENSNEVFSFKDRSQTTGDNLNQLADFYPMVQLINKKVNHFAEEVLGIDKNDISLSCMWSNAHNNGSMHHFHQHPNSFISGVLYLQCPDCEEIGNLVFNDPRQAKNMQYADFKKSSCISNRTIWVKPRTGLLVLFPSWLEHGTDVFVCDGKEKRISLSFNYVLKQCSFKTMKI
jgi:uncharacterized protein (TIGR02466 family)